MKILIPLNISKFLYYILHQIITHARKLTAAHRAPQQAWARLRPSQGCKYKLQKKAYKRAVQLLDLWPVTDFCHPDGKPVEGPPQSWCFVEKPSGSDPSV